MTNRAILSYFDSRITKYNEAKRGGGEQMSQSSSEDEGTGDPASQR